jgi:Flp pilus assembly protein CpaB
MKLAVVVLVMLGLLAAGAAVVLVQAMAFNRGGTREVATIDVLVAQTDLPVRTRITGDNVTVKPMPKAGLPQGYFTDPSQAIGKFLKLAMAKDQPLAESYFQTKTGVDDLLRPGMLAFQIPLSRSSTAVDLLYPGCTVDVFATFPLYDRAKGEAVVTPLLQNIRVLGVRDETVVSPAEEKGAGRLMSSSGSSSRSGQATVTLEVNSRQVAALQLALQRGQLGLAMRNPLDKEWNSMEPMVVKEGQLTAASEALDPATLALFSRIQQMLTGVEPTISTGAAPATAEQKPGDPNAVAKPAPTAPPAVPEYVAPRPQQKRAWPVTIIRGQKVEETEVNLNEKKAEE